MPYIDRNNAEQMAMVKNHRDLTMSLRLIEEQYRRMFPARNYYALDFVPSNFVNNNTPIGQPNKTKVDPLYGEVVDPSMTTIIQSQLSGNIPSDITTIKRWSLPKTVNMRVVAEPEERELKRWGFDLARRYLIYIPTVLLDDEGITVQINDRIDHRNDRVDILQWGVQRYYRDTNIPLILVLAGDRVREGS